MKNKLLIVLIFLFALSCSKAPPPRGNNWNFSFFPEETLLIGNSHTYYNGGVAFHLQEFLTTASLEYSPNVDQIAKGGYAMEHHYEDSETVTKVNSTDWDIMVLQENTYFAVNEKDKALSGTRSVRSLVQNKNTRVYLFMTWAYRDEPEHFRTLKDFYEELASYSGAKVIPVGLAFQEILNDDAMEISLYDPDGVHTTLEGTYLTAAMFAMAIYDIDPTESDYTAFLDEATADYLKQKAKEVYTSYTD